MLADELENLTLTGIAAIDGGNGASNAVAGNAGANVWTAVPGALGTTVKGGAGDDVY